MANTVPAGASIGFELALLPLHLVQERQGIGAFKPGLGAARLAPSRSVTMAAKRWFSHERDARGEMLAGRPDMDDRQE
jgi:hypothetical protein